MPSYRAVRLDFWFDLSCPYAYLACQRLPQALGQRSVEVRYRPMLLGGVFRAIGAGDGPMATLSPGKRAHLASDLARWAAVAGVPLSTPAAHPMRTVLALRTLLALEEQARPRAVRELFAAYWQRGEDLTREDTIAAALARAGLAEGVIREALAAAPGRKEELHRCTEEAVALGVFGAPAFVVDAGDGQPPQFFWGQDRLQWVAAALDGWRPPAPAPAIEAAPLPGRARTLDFFFDVASPYAYLGLSQIERVARGHHLRLRPILLGGLFREIGTPDVPLLTFPAAKRAYVAKELSVWAAWWSQPFSFPARFPQRTITAQRMLALAAPTDLQLRLALALARGMWAEGRNLEDPTVLTEIASEAGAPTALVTAATEPAAKAALLRNTAEAAAAGVFGVPTVILEEEDGRRELFWGQDRLVLVERALAAP